MSYQQPPRQRGQQPYPPPQQYPPQQPPYPQPSQPPPGYSDYPPSPDYAIAPSPNNPPGRVRRPRRRGRRGCSIGPGCILGCVGLVGFVLLGFLIAGWLTYDYMVGRLEDKIDAIDYLGDNSETTLIYDRYGTELDMALLGNDMFENECYRVSVPLDQISPYLIDATIATEDKNFRKNTGVDIPAIIRAVYKNATSGGQGGGASTITQQLVRNVLFTAEYRTQRSYTRKIDEALLAVILNQRWSKDDIINLYLNTIFYGHYSCGIEMASRTFFGKSAKDLTLAESALLAGIPQTPAIYDPLSDDQDLFNAALERQAYVLDRMAEDGYITEQEAENAKFEQLNFRAPYVPLEDAPHFILYAQDELVRLFQREFGMSEEDAERMINSEGLRLYTTLDLDYQHLAENAARNQVAQLSASNNLSNAAVVIIKVETGEVLAMVGSVDYNNAEIDGEVNMAAAPRQPGSAMKPFTYASALEKGWQPGMVIWDTETHIGDPSNPYSPVNYDGTFHGPVRMRAALANSLNIPAVQTLRQVGVDYLLWMMQRAGVESLGMDASQYGLSLTLGGGELTPLELTNAYAMLANQGSLAEATTIRCVTYPNGEVIYERANGCPQSSKYSDQSRRDNSPGRPIIDERIAFVISDFLADNNARSTAMGSNSPLYTPGLPTSVKTGTTNDFKDNWTVGYTHQIAVGVWAGNSNNEPMVNVSGLHGAAPIWHEVITSIYNTPGLLEKVDLPAAGDPSHESHLVQPGGVSLREVCAVNFGALKDPSTACASGGNEWFFDGPVMVPDENGNLVPGPVIEQQPLSANGPQPVEIEPGIIRVAVFPVQVDLANAIAAQDTSGKTVPPRYCQVPIEVAGSVGGVQEQLFIAPPPDADDAFYARRWAQASGVAILPQFACNEQMLAMGPGMAGGGIPAGVTMFISSPTPGQTLPAGSQLDVIGTASWGAGQAQFYKIEIKGGPFPDFTTLGDVNSWPFNSGVSNGVLASVMAGVLTPGSYIVQLVMVGPDSNYIGQPYQVQFNVG